MQLLGSECILHRCPTLWIMTNSSVLPRHLPHACIFSRFSPPLEGRVCRHLWNWDSYVCSAPSVLDVGCCLIFIDSRVKRHALGHPEIIWYVLGRIRKLYALETLANIIKHLWFAELDQSCISSWRQAILVHFILALAIAKIDSSSKCSWLSQFIKICQAFVASSSICCDLSSFGYMHVGRIITQISRQRFQGLIGCEYGGRSIMSWAVRWSSFHLILADIYCFYRQPQLLLCPACGAIIWAKSLRISCIWMMPTISCYWWSCHHWPCDELIWH